MILLDSMTIDKYRGKRHSVTFPQTLAQTIQTLANNENRTFSQMAVQLCSEALKTREDKTQ